MTRSAEGVTASVAIAAAACGPGRSTAHAALPLGDETDKLAP